MNILTQHTIDIISQLSAEQLKQIIDRIKPVPVQTKKENAIRLLQEWMADDSGYDEKIWESLKNNIEENRISERKRFHD